MIIPNPKTGVSPRISSKAFIAPNATIIGDVLIKEGANIWPNVVIRGDYGYIEVGKNCSIQDNTMLHADIDKPVIIADNVLVGHNAVVHGKCRIDEYSMIGIHASVLHGSIIGRGSIVGSGAVVNKPFEDFSMILGVPGKLKKKLTEEAISNTKYNLQLYLTNSAAYIAAGYSHQNLDEFLIENP